MKHFGDITKINGHEVPIVDIITGGSPCQDLSVAGKRAGLAGERSGLFMEQIRIIKEMHDECRRANEPIRPRLMVWENVEGVFSSNGGEDFRAVLEETARVVNSDTTIPRLPNGASWSNAGAILGDGWSIAWRVHDSQFWGVPQRRRRVSLIADFRGQSAPEILFERESVSRNSQPSEETRESTPEDIGRSSDAISFRERAGCDGGVKASLSKTEKPEPSQLSTTNTSSMVQIEGNGSRPSHHGDGYCESNIAYTLNATEHHAVAFSQDAYDKYSTSDVSAALKQSGGNYGGVRKR